MSQNINIDKLNETIIAVVNQYMKIQKENDNSIFSPLYTLFSSPKLSKTFSEDLKATLEENNDRGLLVAMIILDSDSPNNKLSSLHDTIVEALKNNGKNIFDEKAFLNAYTSIMEPYKGTVADTQYEQIFKKLLDDELKNRFPKNLDALITKTFNQLSDSAENTHTENELVTKI